jgi:hypothetical protein
MKVGPIVACLWWGGWGWGGRFVPSGAFVLVRMALSVVVRIVVVGGVCRIYTLCGVLTDLRHLIAVDTVWVGLGGVVTYGAYVLFPAGEGGGWGHIGHIGHWPSVPLSAILRA